MLPQALRHRAPRIWTLQVQGRLMALMVMVLTPLLASLERLFLHYQLLQLHQVRLHSCLLLQLLLSREEGEHPLHVVVLLAEEEVLLQAGVWPVLPGVPRQRAEAGAVTDASVCLRILIIDTSVTTLFHQILVQFWFPEFLLSLGNVVLRAVCCLKAAIVADDMLSKVVPIN